MKMQGVPKILRFVDFKNSYIKREEKLPFKGQNCIWNVKYLGLSRFKCTNACKKKLYHLSNYSSSLKLKHKDDKFPLQSFIFIAGITVFTSICGQSQSPKLNNVFTFRTTNLEHYNTIFRCFTRSVSLLSSQCFPCVFVGLCVY